MEVITISGAIAGAAAVVTIVAVHEAPKCQRQVAQEQGHFAYQRLIEQNKTIGFQNNHLAFLWED